MIVTCTMNPAIDLFVSTEKYLPEVVNRTNGQEPQANGKGVNISFVLKMLGIDNTATGFIGGFTGKYIQEQLNEKGINTQFIEVDGTTRINVFTQVESEQQQYNLVNPGPVISEDKIENLLAQVEKLAEGDVLFVSGSNPKGVSDEVLLQIAKLSHEKGFDLVLDTSSAIVLDCLEYQPYCIKPNEHELAAWFHKETLSREELIDYGKYLIECGAKRVLLSLGENGGMYFDDQQMLEANSPKGKVINTACAGDATLGTFVGELLKGTTVKEAFKKGTAAGSSTAFSQGLTDFTDVEELQKEINVRIIKDEESVKNG